ncbi:MAG: hypothetical protein ABFC38_09195 [Methanospirillum sp.]
MIETEGQPVFRDSLQRLIQWVEGQEYTGWDAFDGLNSPLLNRVQNPYFRIAALQASKISPINFRPLLKIAKGIDLKGMALFSQAYASLYRTTGEEQYKNKLDNALRFIKERSLKGTYGYHCWSSHYYPYTGSDQSTLSVDVPDIIGTCQVIIALLDSYAISDRADEKEMAFDAARFLTNELFHDDDEFPFFGYSKNHGGDDRITLNASAQAIEALSHVLVHNPDFDCRTSCEKAVQTLLTTQKPDGSWDYSINRDGSTKRVQLDFHQGFIIDGLLAYLPHSSATGPLKECINRAAEYYRTVLFRANGSSYYRYPLPYPIDIHNQAQGIITFGKMRPFDKNYPEFTEKIGRWTITNMQDASGFFYYQKWPGMLNKIPYMRWGQAWMMRAMSQFTEITSGDV